jgi:hypothetical protein
MFREFAFFFLTKQAEREKEVAIAPVIIPSISTWRRTERVCRRNIFSDMISATQVDGG